MSARTRGAWYLSRLRAMGLHEVSVRARREVAVRGDAAAWRVAPAVWRRGWCPTDAAFLAGQPLLDQPLGLLDDERIALLERSLPDATGRLVAKAEDALAGRLQFFGYPSVTLAEPRHWSSDPFTGRTWPDRHGKLLDYRHAEAGDPKWAWELNRCQDLPLLAAAWRLTGDERFGAGALRLLSGWLDDSVPARGIAWSNGFEAGLRAISFALTYDSLRGSELLDAPRARTILRALWQHARFILRDLSPASSANNHLVGELAGLATIGFLAPELRDAARFREAGLAGLAREAERQVLPDGTGAEQAFGYHLFILDLMLLVSALAEKRGAPTPPEITQALTRAADAVVLQVAGDDPDPTYGDSDDGRAFVFDGESTRGSRGVAAAIAACLGHSGAKRLAGAPDAAAIVLFGGAGVARFDSAPDTDEPAGGLLSDSGLVVLRRGGTRALVDAGPLGYLSLAAHGHADALQVTLAEGGVDLVTDPGTGSYFGDPARRAAFRGTAFHATVGVDGLDQAEQAGSFLWRRHYRSSLALLDLERGVVVAEHDGYRRLPDPVRHRRAVLSLEDGSLLVYDRLDARERHRYVQTWPLHPSLDASCRGDIVEAGLDGTPRLLVAITATEEGRLELHRGETKPLAGWSSRRLEQAEPAWAAQYHVECEQGAGFAALLLVARGRPASDPKLTLTHERGVATLAVVHGGSLRVVEIDLDDPAAPVRSSAGGLPREILR
ncbi:MAG: alginate lyase family protein [Actinomycetota bacterium]